MAWSVPTTEVSIEATSTTAFHLRLSPDAKLDSVEITGDTEKGAAVFGFFEDCPYVEPYDCVHLSAYLLPSLLDTMGGVVWDAHETFQRTAIVHVVTEEPVLVTLRYVGGSGVSVTGTSPSVASALPLEQRCDACDTLAYGGDAVELHHPSFVAVLAYSLVGGGSYVGGAGEDVCMYPNPYDRSASSNPADYPLGCDTSVRPDSGHVPAYFVYALPNCPLSCGEITTWQSIGIGRVYGGFVLEYLGDPQNWERGATIYTAPVPL